MPMRYIARIVATLGVIAGLGGGILIEAHEVFWWITLTGALLSAAGATMLAVTDDTDEDYGGRTTMVADHQSEFWARMFPNSLRAAEFDDKYGTNYSGRRPASRSMSSRDVNDARWGRGPMAGKTGNPFLDDPLFNPWAPGGVFNKKH